MGAGLRWRVPEALRVVADDAVHPEVNERAYQRGGVRGPRDDLQSARASGGDDTRIDERPVGMNDRRVFLNRLGRGRGDAVTLAPQLRHQSDYAPLVGELARAVAQSTS